MTYIVSGLIATIAMLAYRRPPAANSPLWLISIPSNQLSSRLTHEGNRHISQLALSVSFSVLVIVAATRYGIGTDYWARYAPLFNLIQNDRAAGYEVGFVLLNKLAGSIAQTPQAIFALMSVLTIALYYRFILRMSVNPALSVYIYAFGGFYLEAFNLIQQGLAIAILLNTIEYALRRKPFSFATLVVLAALVHSSALVWLAVWPLFSKSLNRRVRLSIATTLIAVVVVTPQVIPDIIRRFVPAYSWYLDSNYGSTRGVQFVVVAVAVMVFVIGHMQVGKAEAKIQNSRRLSFGVSNDREENTATNSKPTHAAAKQETNTRTVHRSLRHQETTPAPLPIGLKINALSKKATNHDARIVNRMKRPDKYATAVLNLLSLSTAVMIATLTVAYFFSRLNYYFAPVQILAAPLALSLIQGRPSRHLVTTIVICAYFIGFFYQFLVWNAHGVLPYKSVLLP